MCDAHGDSAWQRMPLGVTVVCRGFPWRLKRVETADGVAAIDVHRAAVDAPSLSTLLSPFDRLSACGEVLAWRQASRHRLRHVIAALDGAWSEAPLASLASTTSAPWPHQLVPALAMTHGRGMRILLADEVGLGKTMAAGLAIAELTARDLAARVLLLTPAGLRDQWRAELGHHLRMAAEVVDARVLANLVRDVPADRSPWLGSGCRILSLDFAKQPAVLRSLAQETWDALVIDEAHTVSGDSQRAAAARALALRSRFVLLLTATPHNGIPLSFRKLASLGFHGDRDPLVWIRRGRLELGVNQARKTRTWRLHSTAAEIEVQRALHAYAARVDNGQRPEARLAMIVLKKRTLSSPDALLCSLRRRLECLSGRDVPVLATATLPFDAGESDDGDDVQPASLAARGLADHHSELDALRALAALADNARHNATKYRLLDRIVSRTTEPAILFTEYRDTLHAVAARLSLRTSVAVIHGGLDRIGRGDAIRRFTHGDARILVATDAAAEGLNLQARCRFVIHLDLPWSPTTLTQRVGRVDRIGQSRQVRVWHLATAGGHEEAVVSALATRLRRIHREIGGPFPSEWARLPADSSTAAETDADVARNDAGDLAPNAERVARAARLFRSLQAKVPLQVHGDGRPPRGIPWLRTRRLTKLLGSGVVFLFTVFPRRRGEVRTHVAVQISLTRVPCESPRLWLPWLVARAADNAIHAVPPADLLCECAASRETELQQRAAAEHRRLHGRWQPSLFDDRASRVIDVARDRIDKRLDAHSRRLDELGATDDRPFVVPVLALIVK